MAKRSQTLLLRLALWALLSTSVHAFVTTPTSRSVMTTSRIPPFARLRMAGDDNNNNSDEKEEDFLDRQFFDPSTVKEGSPLKWFANMVENDYETAEALFASFIIAILVFASQELLRFQIYGDQYVPFKKLGGTHLW